MRFKRIFLIILDSLGVGSTKDAHIYGDEGANTLGSILKNTNILIPNLKLLGLTYTLDMGDNKSMAYYTIAKPISIGKDTLTGHHELMGLKTTIPYIRFTDNGFPIDLIKKI